jgi:hypothetical protein
MTFRSKAISIIKTPKNVVFSQFSNNVHIFWVFAMLIASDKKLMESSGTSHFVENRLLNRPREIKRRFFRYFELLKN